MDAERNGAGAHRNGRHVPSPPKPPAPRRVLMTADVSGGVWTYALELAQALSAHGVTVSLATMGPRPSPAQRQAAARVPGLELHESDFKLEWMEEPWRDVARAGAWLLALETRVAPDLVHLNGYAHAVLPWRAPALVVGHSCVCSWWRAVHGRDAPAAWDRYRQVVASGLAAARLVIAPSAAMLAALGTHYGAPASARVIHHARNPEGFRSATKRPLVLGVGRVWDEAKNMGALDRAARRCPWAVAIAGETRAPGGPKHGLWRAKTLGALEPEALARWYSQAAIFAHPARYEPFGFTALEAALSGCALVLGDLPSLREVWDDAALYVRPADEDALATTLTRLVRDGDLREELARRAIVRASRYAPGRFADEYLNAYRALPLLPHRAGHHQLEAGPQPLEDPGVIPHNT